jgi:putative transposase
MTTQLCSENQVITIEDLNVKGMLKNKKLSRSISDAGWGLISQQLSYKSKIYNDNLIIAPRFYPSSKTCSHCGAVRKKLDLSERIFTCPTCGFVIDRDRNASLNLCTLGHKGIQTCGQDVSLNMEAVLDEAGTNL